MRDRRSFSLEFKREVVEELLSEESEPAQIYRWHNIQSSLPKPSENAPHLGAGRFFGVGALYEEPSTPEIVVETDKCSLEECVEQIT